MATTKAYELGQLGGTLDVDSANNITLSGNLDAKYSGFDSDFTAKSTSDLSEGSNLYYTTTRFDTRLATKSTDDLSEGSNLYYTDARADARIAAATTADLTEGSNLYYTTARGDSDTGVYISGDRSYGNITTTGYIRGPATFYIDPAPVDSDAGLLVIRGDLQVDGTTTTVNSTTVSINDKNIVLADSAANASEADGAGITVNGASATITYDASNDEWDFNKDINVTGTATTDGLTVSGTGVVGTLSSSNNNTVLRVKGNGATNGGAIGSTSSDDLVLLSGLTEQIRITSAGNVGIGTVSPNSYSSQTTLTINGSTYGRLDLESAGTLRASLFATTGSTTLAAATDVLSFDTSGGESMRIDGSGNVGIGTTSPNERLAVVAESDSSAINNGFSIYRSVSDDKVTINAQGGAAKFIADGGSSYIPYRFFGHDGTNTTEWMTILSDGNVGIGTASPSGKLEVGGGSGSTGVQSYFSVSAGYTNPAAGSASHPGGAKIILWNDTSTPQKASIGMSSNADIWFNNAGAQAGAGFTFYTGNGASATPEARLKITKEGNVGINTSSPAAPLHINSDTEHQIKVSATSAAGASMQLETAGGYSYQVFTNSSKSWRMGAYGGSSFQLLNHTDSITPLTVLSGGNVGIGTASPSTKLHVVGDGSIADNAAATIGLDLETGNITSGAQYGLKINQLGSRYNGQVGVFSEILDTSGYYSGDTIEGLGSVRGVGVLGKVPGSSHAYQRNVGIWGISENTAMNYNTAYGVRGEAAVGTSSFSNTNSTEQGAFAGWFQAHGKGRSVGVYADAYLDASPGAGAEAIPIVAASNGTEVFRVQANGNVGIGTTSPTSKLELPAADKSATTTHHGLAGYAGINLTIPNTIGRINQIVWTNEAATSHGYGSIGMVMTSGSGVGTGDMIFSTKGVGTNASSTERLRITSGGTTHFGSSTGYSLLNPSTVPNVTIGVPSGSGVLIVGECATPDSSLNIRDYGGNAVGFWYSSNKVGSITLTTSGTTYNTTSDRRLKDNIVTITDGKEKILAMNPVTHTWKADPDAQPVHGFIAQEIQNVVPEAVSGDAESEDMMSMDYGRITPVIVAALQDALKEIEELKTRINELEAK